jgi:hypothetical protein
VFSAQKVLDFEEQLLPLFLSTLLEGLSVFVRTLSTCRNHGLLSRAFLPKASLETEDFYQSADLIALEIANLAFVSLHKIRHHYW